MSCNHNAIDTKYCPECGQQLLQHDAASLVRYLRQNLATIVRDNLRMVEPAPGSTRTPERHQSRLASRERLAAKWTAWVAIVEAVVVDKPE